jgi:hypothetical protein
VSDGCWVALRARGAAHPSVLGREVFAHTSPVYVIVDGRGAASADDAAYFVEWIDRFIELAVREGRYPSDEARDAVLATFAEGRAWYEAMAAAR